MNKPALLLVFVTSAWLGGFRGAQASTLPDLDPMIHRMQTYFAPIDPINNLSQKNYFDAPIPKQVHQIWFGDPTRRCDDHPAQWRKFAQDFGYVYRLWTDDDLAELKNILPKKNFDLLTRLLACKEVYAASDLLRISLLQNLGGIYCDVDMSPPHVDDKIVDLAEVMPMRGLVLLTENFAMNVGNSAMFFANGLMMASKAHPILTHLQNQLPLNMLSLNPQAASPSAPLCQIDAVYATGPGFLSRSLSGVFTLLPITYARRLGMVHDGKWDAESSHPYTLSEVDGWEFNRCSHYAR